MNPTPCRLTALALLLLAIPITGQQLSERLDAVDHAARMERIALTGDLGLPELPPVYADSPRDDLRFADRFPVGQGPFEYEDGVGPGVIVDAFLPAGPRGTGTDKFEVFKYQLGSRYDPLGPPHPMVIAYHGYGASANSPANVSTIDEECNARSIVYMSPTGIDDQLFGAPIGQQNVSAAIQFMLDNFNIDEDRIYMVGFSMGAGIVGNYAARHRDPDGIMIAAIGLVSGSFDWTVLYHTGGPSTKFILENEYNFGGSADDFPFRYQQASVMYFDPFSYLPLPGIYLERESMATNLGSIPVYMTWDTGDTVTYVLDQNPILEAELVALGSPEVQTKIVSGTINPDTGNPATHSWQVLDEVELFDFFEGKVVDRTPAAFEAQADLGGKVSWTESTQRTVDAFTWYDGTADEGTTSASVTDVENATEVIFDASLAGLTGPGPYDLDISSADADGFSLRLEGFSAAPSYLVDDATGLIIPGVVSDPLADAVSVPVAGMQVLDTRVVIDPNFTTKHYSSPNPVPYGQTATIEIDAPATSDTCFWILGFSELLTPLQTNFKLTISVVGPSAAIPLTLDANGDATIPLTIPDDPAFSGVYLLMQVITTDVESGQPFDSVSNLWRLDIE